MCVCVCVFKRASCGHQGAGLCWVVWWLCLSSLQSGSAVTAVSWSHQHPSCRTPCCQCLSTWWRRKRNCSVCTFTRHKQAAPWVRPVLFWYQPVHFPPGVWEDNGKAEMGALFSGLRIHLLHKASQLLQISIHPGSHKQNQRWVCQI